MIEANRGDGESGDEGTQPEDMEREEGFEDGVADDSRQEENKDREKTGTVDTRLTEEQQEKRANSKKGRKKVQKYANDEIEQLSKVTRWLPSTSFATYFGKPPFHAYGAGNTNPTNGGTVYGSYMLTHNIAPQEGRN